MDLFFIICDVIGIVVAWGYFRCGARSSGFVTLLLSALTLIRKVTWIQWVGVVLILLISLCYALFRTRLGAFVLKLFGRDNFGRKLKK